MLIEIIVLNAVILLALTAFFVHINKKYSLTSPFRLYFSIYFSGGISLAINVVATYITLSLLFLENKVFFVFVDNLIVLLLQLIVLYILISLFKIYDKYALMLISVTYGIGAVIWDLYIWNGMMIETNIFLPSLLILSGLSLFTLFGYYQGKYFSSKNKLYLSIGIFLPSLIKSVLMCSLTADNSTPIFIMGVIVTCLVCFVGIYLFYSTFKSIRAMPVDKEVQS